MKDTLDRMEPDIHHLDLSAALPSLAISLKRIADNSERIADLLEVVTLPSGEVITLPQILLSLVQCFTLPGPDKGRLNLAEVVESIHLYGIPQSRVE